MGPSHLAPPGGNPPRPQLSSTSSHVSSIHAQEWVPPVTLESLDNEGVIQLPPDQAADLLYRLDGDHQDLHDAEEEGEEENGLLGGEGEGVGRDDSAHWNRLRHESRMGRRWWKRPSPYWLLIIQIGHAVSMGSSIAPKSEIYNSLACLVHYPTTSNDVSSPVYSEPVVPGVPSVPRPLPDQPSTSPVGAPNDTDTDVPHATSSSSAYSFALDGYPNLDPVKCRKSPEVQRATAQFATAMTITQGVLAALTTGWWGRLSDRFGRKKVMATAMAGIIFGDIIFLVTAKFPTRVPGGYRFLLIGPLFDGLLGGMPTMGATNNAYIADCTPDGTRAQIYSRFAGIMMLGLAIGPILGSVIISQTKDVLSVFYFSAGLHTCTFLIVIFLLPESLSKAARGLLAKQAEMKKAADDEREEAERSWEDEEDVDCQGDEDPNASGWSRLTSQRAQRKSKGMLKRALKRTFGFLSPLEIFWPGFVERLQGTEEMLAKGRKKNWNLTLLAFGYGSAMCLLGVYQYKFQYVQLSYGWGPAELGPFLSTIGAARALHLLLILPVLVRWFKPKSPQRTSSSRAPSLASGVEGSIDPHASHRALHDSRFDLKIIKASMGIELLAYAGIVISSGPIGFLAATALTPFGGGAGPAMSSLALALLPSTRIAGRLFGAMAVLQAIIATVVGPLLFGTTYALTTRIFPKAVFVLVFVILLGALTSFSLIRLDPPSDGIEGGAGEGEGVLTVEQDVERGRKRKPRTINASGFSTRVSLGEGDSGFSLRTGEGGVGEGGTSSGGSSGAVTPPK